MGAIHFFAFPIKPILPFPLVNGRNPFIFCDSAALTNMVLVNHGRILIFILDKS